MAVNVPGRRIPGIGAHHSARPKSDEWITPPYLLDALGPFDLDPCSPDGRPWPTAAAHLTPDDDGLHTPWAGRVWLNPPYSDGEAWMARMAEHGHGTALLFARTDTGCWHRHIWPRATALLFLAGRITFCEPDGTPAKKGHNSGGPSVLIAYGPADAAHLAASGLRAPWCPRRW